MRVLIIDNFSPNRPEIYRLHDVLKEMVIDSLEIHNYSAAISEEALDQFDVFFLSDSDQSLSDPGVYEQYHLISEFIRRNEKPLLGISFGFQLIAMSFDARIDPLKERREGYHPVDVITKDPLFSEMEEKFLVYMDHQSIVRDLPMDFILLASSPQVPIEAFRHNVHPIYGVQFLPHIFDEKHPIGRKVLENFLSIARLYT
ncbi:hypothetical protein DRP53_04545 [candidate division WOR-3 bacterium]|uniref:Glutamine amidotransferase domain-containing protein n=1 Tax=candidate division WOR-3 bacterium TaxID=2052148 RepID=A0A660SIS3_UNCW3|nr:MAG: hypothetical protein DRP53_04545 [candidate division WOR-3 bacterium]